MIILCLSSRLGTVFENIKPLLVFTQLSQFGRFECLFAAYISEICQIFRNFVSYKNVKSTAEGHLIKFDFGIRLKMGEEVFQIHLFWILMVIVINTFPHIVDLRFMYFSNIMNEKEGLDYETKYSFVACVIKLFIFWSAKRTRILCSWYRDSCDGMLNQFSSMRVSFLCDIIYLLSSGV